jgi:hypothetical protein
MGGMTMSPSLLDRRGDLELELAMSLIDSVPAF